MNVAIEISYISNETKIMRRGSFPAKGRSPEKVAYDWWKQIQREMPFGVDLSQVLIDGEDRTEQVKALL